MYKGNTLKIYHRTPLNRYTPELYESMECDEHERNYDFRDKLVINITLLARSIRYPRKPPFLSIERDQKFHDTFKLIKPDEDDVDYLKDITRNLSQLLSLIKIPDKEKPKFSIVAEDDDNYVITVEKDYWKGINYGQALALLSLAVEIVVIFKDIDYYKTWYGTIYTIDYDAVPFKEYSYYYTLLTKEINKIIYPCGGSVYEEAVDKSTFISRLVTRWLMFRNKK